MQPLPLKNIIHGADFVISTYCISLVKFDLLYFTAGHTRKFDKHYVMLLTHDD